MISKGAGFVYGTLAGIPSWVHLFPVVAYLIRATLQSWTLDPRTWCFSHVSFFGETSCPISLLAFQFLFSQRILSLLEGVSVLHSNWADTVHMWKTFVSRLKGLEDIIMEVALERGIKDGSSCQGYADSSGYRLPFQTCDPSPPPPTWALFFPK